MTQSRDFDHLSEWLDSVAKELAARIRRHRLVFIHTSACHGELVDAIFGRMLVSTFAAEAFARTDFAEAAVSHPPSGTIVLRSMEFFATDKRAHTPTLGQLRANVHTAAGLDFNVCMVSTVPRSNFPTIPGSSILSDSHIYFLPLLPQEDSDAVGVSILPAMSFGTRSSTDLRSIFRLALAALDVQTLVELDRELCELQTSADLLPTTCSSTAMEDLRSAGFFQETKDELIEFIIPKRYTEFRLALGDAISSIVSAPKDYGEVASNLFTVERILRARVRRTAISSFGEKWRTSILVGDTRDKVLQRAKVEAYPLAINVAEVRDPLEWLTLGELMELISGTAMSHLGKDQRFWSRFMHEVLPIRNRLTHMRLVTTIDAQKTRSWALLVGRAFK